MSVKGIFRIGPFAAALAADRPLGAAVTDLNTLIAVVHDAGTVAACDTNGYAFAGPTSYWFRRGYRITSDAKCNKQYGHGTQRSHGVVLRQLVSFSWQ
ncbi:hypothetical protein GCM10027343_33570 [Noviherbaspirillum agri]